MSEKRIVVEYSHAPVKSAEKSKDNSSELKEDTSKKEKQNSNKKTKEPIEDTQKTVEEVTEVPEAGTSQNIKTMPKICISDDFEDSKVPETCQMPKTTSEISSENRDQVSPEDYQEALEMVENKEDKMFLVDKVFNDKCGIFYRDDSPLKPFPNSLFRSEISSNILECEILEAESLSLQKEIMSETSTSTEASEVPKVLEESQALKNSKLFTTNILGDFKVTQVCRMSKTPSEMSTSTKEVPKVPESQIIKTTSECSASKISTPTIIDESDSMHEKSSSKNSCENNNNSETKEIEDMEIISKPLKQSIAEVSDWPKKSVSFPF